MAKLIEGISSVYWRLPMPEEEPEWNRKAIERADSTSDVPETSTGAVESGEDTMVSSSQILDNPLRENSGPRIMWST